LYFISFKTEKVTTTTTFCQGGKGTLKSMKFIADGMLGKLARWLRLAGHDVTYIGDLQVPSERQDDVLLEKAKLEGRTLLTCDLALHRRAKKAGIRTAFIETKDVVSQLAEISKRSGKKIEIDPENSRCPMCNGVLESVGGEEIKKLVPETVLMTGREFWRCVDCRKVYWQGKHWKTIIEMASRYNRMVE
jgi:uncharacterized protein with PIN domain